MKRLNVSRVLNLRSLLLLAMLGSAGDRSFASIVLVNTSVTTTFSAANAILDLAKQDGTEGGCVIWTGTADATGALPCGAGFNTNNAEIHIGTLTKTAVLSTLGITDAHNLGILIHFHQDNPNPALLHDMVLTIYQPNGTAVYSTSLKNLDVMFSTPVDPTDLPRGTLFQLSGLATINAVQGYLTSNPNYRLGLQAQFKVSGDGTDDQFFVGNYVAPSIPAPVPEPATFPLAGLALVGLGLMRARQDKS